MTSSALPSRLTLDQLAPLLGSLDALASQDALDLQKSSASTAPASPAAGIDPPRTGKPAVPLRFHGASSRLRALTTFLGVDALLDFEEKQSHA
jgi:hypothetical protein